MIIFLVVLLVAYTNGRNDNFKGVTLYGSGAASYRVSLAGTTAFSFLGAVASVFLSMTLVERFSGQGLVPDDIVHTYPLVAVALETGLTVVLASCIDMPVSTTQAITGDRMELSLLRQCVARVASTMPQRSPVCSCSFSPCRCC